MGMLIHGAVAGAAATWLMDIATTDESVDANGWSSEAMLSDELALAGLHAVEGGWTVRQIESLVALRSWPARS